MEVQTVGFTLYRVQTVLHQTLSQAIWIQYSRVSSHILQAKELKLFPLQIRMKLILQKP